MRTILILVALLAACSDGGIEPTDPHALDECDASWGPNFEGQTCEFACRSMPQTNGDTCPATLPGGGAGNCTNVFESLGVRGCCANTGSGFVFAECE